MKEPSTPQEIIVRAQGAPMFATKTIHDSYLLFLRFFKGDFSEDKLLQGAYMVYGWMPTMLRIKGPVKNIVDLAVAGREGKITEDILGNCAKTLNNSLVGTTKLLHFLCPDTYPIWDSRVYRGLFGQKPYRCRVEQVDAYTKYLDWMETLEKCDGFDAMKARFEAEAGYQVSSKRAAEAVLYALGKPEKKKT